MAKKNHIYKLYELKAFPLWIFILIGVIAFVSSGISLYFIFIGVPNKTSDTNLMAVIVGILSLLVTLLVAWQIWTTIKAKEELKELQKEIRDRFETDIKALQNQLTGLRIKQARTEGQEKEPRPNNTFCRLNDVVCRNLKLNDFEKAKIATPLYKWLWNMAKSRSSSNDPTIALEYMQGKSEGDVNFMYIDGFVGGKEALNLLMEIRYIQGLTKDIDNNPLKPTLH